MDAPASLDAGLLVGGDDELVLAQRLALPAARIQVQDAPGLGLELRVAREYPAAVLPRTDRILVQPTPHGAVADARNNAAVLCIAGHIGHAQPRQWNSQRGGQL
jgi:hypothetical protein